MSGLIEVEILSPSRNWIFRLVIHQATTYFFLQTIPSMFPINRFFRVVLIFVAAIVFVFVSLGAAGPPASGLSGQTSPRCKSRYECPGRGHIRFDAAAGNF